jgi:ornithine racemase
LRIEVDCERVRRNAKAIVTTCARRKIEVVGVTKATCGHPQVAQAMLAGGVSLLAESRLSHVRRLRNAGIDADVMLLRLPALSEVSEMVQLAQMSLNSQVETVRAISRAAERYGVVHQVLLMIETGDRREGVMPEEALGAASQMVGLPNIDLVGVGANVSCIGGVLPTRDNTQLLVDVAENLEHALGIQFRVVSGGHTASLALIERDQMPARVNQLRIGEGILLGVDSAGNWPLPVPYQDVFNIVAEVVEIDIKPSMPEGPITVDAFGRTPHWEDLGLRRRAILAMGEQDLRVDGLRPRRPDIAMVGASSDHLVVDVTEAYPPVHLGDELEFKPNYAAVATAMGSYDVTRVIRPHEGG